MVMNPRHAEVERIKKMAPADRKKMARANQQKRIATIKNQLAAETARPKNKQNAEYILQLKRSIERFEKELKSM